MRRARVQRSDYPSPKLLTILLNELAPSVPIERVLEHSSSLAYPSLLSPCVELDLSQCSRTSFVMSQQRAHGKSYVTVHGRRDYDARARVKKQRSQQSWPRTRETKRLRPVCLHRWIAVVAHGLPPSTQHEAAHICGNDRCIASSHIRWQFPIENIRDRTFHASCASPSPTTACSLKRYYSRTAWPAQADETVEQASVNV